MKAYLVEAGRVIYQPAPGNRPEIVWSDCERCGPQAPRLEADEYHTWLMVPSGRPVRRGYCSNCGNEAPIRYVAWRESKRKHVRCDKRCLDATRDDCNCSSCMGKCHGLGVCSCKKEENDGN